MKLKNCFHDILDFQIFLLTISQETETGTNLETKAVSYHSLCYMIYSIWYNAFEHKKH